MSAIVEHNYWELQTKRLNETMKFIIFVAYFIATPEKDYGGYGRAQRGYGRAPGGYGRAPGGYGRAQRGYGRAQGGYGRAQGGYGRAQGGYGRTMVEHREAMVEHREAMVEHREAMVEHGGYGRAQGGYGRAPWLWSLFIRAHKKDLEFSDLYRCSKSDETHRVRPKLEIEWNKQLKSKSKPSLLWAIFTSFGPELTVLYIPDAIKELGLSLFQSYCVVYLVRHFNNDPNTSQWWAIWAAVGIVLTGSVYLFVLHLNLASSSKVGVRIRVACCALIYRKSLRLSHSSLGKTTVGQLLNIMSNDIQRFDEFAIYSRSLFVAPLQAAIVLYLLWSHLRWACLTGMGILALFIPFQVLMSRVNLSLYFVLLRVIIYACFLTYILMGEKLSAETAFATIAYFNALRWGIGMNAPLAIAALSELIIVIKRIQNFLLLEEMSGLVEREGKDNEAFISGENEIIFGVMDNNFSDEEKGVFMDNMSVRWNKDMTEPTLRDISLSLKPGELLAVVGSVGSGKNILFGSQYNEEKYNRVVKACALDTDFKLMPFGDKTLVGERGLALSGGQKARLSLARALYHSADIYLLDDPLSAVDTHVAKHIYQKCCVKYLKEKVTILMTHSIQFLCDAHQILVLNDGECVAIGSYHQLKERGIDLMAYQRQTDETNHNRAVKRRTSVTPSIVSTISEESEVTDVRDAEEVDEQEVKAELKMIGSVETSVYLAYIKAGAGPLLVILTILFLIVSQVLYQGSVYWLSLWTNEMRKTPDKNILCVIAITDTSVREFADRSNKYTRSPVYSHVNTTLCGLTSIRAFGAQHMFERQFEVHQNDNTSTNFLIIFTSRALGVLMDTICILYLISIITYIMISSNEILGGNAGLLLTSALSLTTVVQWSVKLSADTESYMTAVERVLEYIAIKPEAELESTPDRKPPKNWPQMGEITPSALEVKMIRKKVEVLSFWWTSN
ncbi:unnamed protein product, partial [Medioppia subpectinata]